MAGLRILVYSLARCIEPHAADRGPNEKGGHVENSQEHLPRTFEVSSFVQEQPKYAAKSVSEPAREKGTDQC